MSGTSSRRCAGESRSRPSGGRVVADDVVDPRAASRRDPVELVGEDDVVGGDDPVEGDEVAVHLLEQRAHRRDPDPARDQERLVAVRGSRR